MVYTYHAHTCSIHTPAHTYAVCGNKSDLAHIRAISEAEGKAFSTKEGLFFLETSAKTADNVTQAFTTLLGELYKSSTKSLAGVAEGEKVYVNTDNAIKIVPDAKPVKSRCCQ